MSSTNSSHRSLSLELLHLGFTNGELRKADMQYTRVGKKSAEPERDPRIYADLDELVRLQFEAQGFSFLPRQPVHSILHGRHASRLRGRGLNFEELREYVVGDDIRNVDWRATARTGRTQVRVYTEERDRPVWLLVNQRQSMFFGSQDRMKSVTAAEAAALAAWRVLGGGDRVGAMVFDDDEIVTIRPHRSRGQVMRVLEAIVEKNHALRGDARVPANPAILNDALRRLIPLATHDSLICIIGDGSAADETTRELATRLAAHNDLLFVMVFDPLEVRIPPSGRLMASDGLRWLSFDSDSKSLGQGFERLFRSRAQWIEDAARQRAIPVLPVSTAEPVAIQIRERLGHRGPARRA
jgi:uncharacterized protein (DUF58 family)